MCGIAGQFNYERKDIQIYKDIFNKMQDTMYNRGPDQKGVFIYENVALIHSRLLL